MSLAINSLFTDVDEIWDALCVPADVRIVKDAVMMRWANMASSFIERMINRPAMPREFVDCLNGDGRSYVNVTHTPLISVQSLTVWGCDFLTRYDVDLTLVKEEGAQVHIDYPNGRIVLLRRGPLCSFLLGHGNVQICYTAGFETGDLEVLKEAAVEMIAVRYNELGRNPREQTRSDTINTLSTFTKGDFDELPWMMKQAVMHYRSHSF